MRERVGIIDMTSFGKLEVSGAGALALLERVCDNRIDKPVGSVVYTQLLDDRGGIVGDVTVTRLADDRFRVVTGAGAVDSDRGFLELNGDATIEDVTDELAVIGIWGPRGARGALGRHLGRRLARGVPVPHGEGDRRSAARPCSRSGSRTSASSGTSSLARAWAVQVWDELMCRGVAASRSATRRSTRCGSRRATATSAPT